MNEERILDIIRDHILYLRMYGSRDEGPHPKREAFAIAELEKVLDKIAMDLGVPAADVRVPVGPRA